MNILPGNMRFGAGKSVKRLEDQRLLTGKGQFIDDKPEEGALWLHVLRSPHAHARIKSIDTKAAAAMTEVEAVYTGADLVARAAAAPAPQTAPAHVSLRDVRMVSRYFMTLPFISKTPQKALINRCFPLPLVSWYFP